MDLIDFEATLKPGARLSHMDHQHRQASQATQQIMTGQGSQ
jgi:hypothetical protein